MNIDAIDAVAWALAAKQDAELHELRGGHIVHGHPRSGRCGGCGLVAAMIEAYGFPTCYAATDVIDGEAHEVLDRPQLEAPFDGAAK